MDKNKRGKKVPCCFYLIYYTSRCIFISSINDIHLKIRVITEYLSSFYLKKSHSWWEKRSTFYRTILCVSVCQINMKLAHVIQCHCPSKIIQQFILFFQQKCWIISLKIKTMSFIEDIDSKNKGHFYYFFIYPILAKLLSLLGRINQEEKSEKNGEYCTRILKKNKLFLLNFLLNLSLSRGRLL